MRNEGSIEMWRGHEQQESKGLAMSQFPSARRFATIPGPRSSRQKPDGSKLCDDATTATTLFSLGLEKKGKERTDRGRAGPQPLFRVRSLQNRRRGRRAVAESMITISYARRSSLRGRSKSSRPRRDQLPGQCNHVMARSGARPRRCVSKIGEWERGAPVHKVRSDRVAPTLFSQFS